MDNSVTNQAGSPKPVTKGLQILTEIPSSLRTLARLVVRGFYPIEDALVIDMLVRYPCMREDDVSSLLKFDKKHLRARMDLLKKDKLVQMKQRIETDEEGHVVKMNCYYINYRTFVNVVKYQLDHMRKKMETSERDQTSRASFKCLNCEKKFTDLEANQLIDFSTGEMRCTFCSGGVDEDQSSEPKKDSRLQLAKFNTEMKPLYESLHQVESVRLAQSLLEPEPVEIESLLKNDTSTNKPKNTAEAPGGDIWSEGKWAELGKGGFNMETQKVQIDFDSENMNTPKPANGVPSRMLQSAVPTEEPADTNPVETIDEDDDLTNGSKKMAQSTFCSQLFDNNDEIQHLLLRHETKSSSGGILNQKVHIPGSDSDDQSDKSERDSDFEEAVRKKNTINIDILGPNQNEDEEMRSGDEDGDIPSIKVGNEEYAITDINESIISQMTAVEKERYIQMYQEFYDNVLD